jgi:hypothetical protein
MKRIAQICLMICGISLCLGVLFLIVGTVMGARPHQYMNLAHVKPWSHMLDGLTERVILDDLDDFSDLDIIDDLDDLDILDDLEDFKDDLGNQKEWGRQEEHNNSRGPETSGAGYDETFSVGVEDVEMDINHGEIHIYVHEETGVRVCASNPGGTFRCWQDDEKLLIQDTRKAKEEKLKLDIYLPISELKELEIDMGAGSLEAQEIQVRELSIDMGAGSCLVEQMFVSEEANLGAGAGRIQVGLFTGRDLEASCGAGEISICLAGGYQDYDYELESAIGQIVLGGKSFSGFAHDQEIKNQASQKVELDCGVGKIEVTFSEN